MKITQNRLNTGQPRSLSWKVFLPLTLSLQFSTKFPTLSSVAPLEAAPLSRLQLVIALGMTLAAAATWMPALQYDFSGGCMDEKAENLWEALH